LIIWGIILSESRTPVVQFIFLAGWLGWGLHRKILNAKALSVLLSAGLFLLGYFIYPKLNAFLNMDSAEQVRIISGDYSGRVAIWSSLMEPLVRFPVLGYGFGQLEIAQYQYLNLHHGMVSHTEYGHNILLDLLIWCGPLCGFLVIGFLTFWLGRRFLKPHGVDDWFLLACVGAVGIHAMLEFPHAYAYFLLPIGIMLGLLDNGKVSTKVLFSVVVQRLWRGVIWVFGFIIMIGIWREYKVLEEDHRVMRAQNLKFSGVANINLSKDVILIDGERDFIRFARQKASKNMPDTEIAWMKKVVYRYPFPVLIYRYSLALALNGREQEANDELHKIAVFHGQREYEYYKLFLDKHAALGYEE
jgi:hypothetical protein